VGQTRANLPTIEPDDENDDDDSDVEVLDASEKLEALTRKTYENLEAQLKVTPIQVRQ